jgi:hypothetical protein
MYDPKRVSISKWTAVTLAVVLLSQSIARWRAFFAAPDFATYFGVTLAVTLLLALLLAMAVSVYAEECNRGTILVPRPFLQKWADRFFLIRHGSSRG